MARLFRMYYQLVGCTNDFCVSYVEYSVEVKIIGPYMGCKLDASWLRVKCPTRCEVELRTVSKITSGIFYAMIHILQPMLIRLS